MPITAEIVTLANDDILASVSQQIGELHLGADSQVELDAILKELDNLLHLGGGLPAAIVKAVIDQVGKIKNHEATWQESGSVLGDLDTLRYLLVGTPNDAKYLIVAGVIARIERLLAYRPDVTSVLSDLEAIKHLKGGPADATAFHDFSVLEVAFKSVWHHVFSKALYQDVEALFREIVYTYDEAGVQLPAIDAIDDVDTLNAFIDSVQNSPADTSPQIPTGVARDFGAIFSDTIGYAQQHGGLPPGVYSNVWSSLSPGQRTFFVKYATFFDSLPDFWGWVANNQKQFDAIMKQAQQIADHPEGRGGRIAKTILEIGDLLSEPYAFDVFAPGSYNYGVMLTYRQKWEPGEYQAGDLRATIPLAPGEVRKYSKKTNVKIARAVKEIEKSMSTRSEQSSVNSRAETEIMQKAMTATNFRMTSNGSFNIGVGNISASSDFGMNQTLDSTTNKRGFHEATLRAAEEYRLERSLEVDTTTTTDTEETTSGEISNPNSEITVTYLFYELQRRFAISESIHRARAVILIAQDVPAPQQVDEAWLIAHQWIISRVLLDDSFRPALNYLTSGMAGDEVAIDVIKAHWVDQKAITKQLESQVSDQLKVRDSLRETMIQSALAKSVADSFEMPTGAKILTLGLAPDPAQKQGDVLQAYAEAAKTRLQYVEQALADAQNKLKQATDAYQKATDQYSAALQNQFNRHEAIDQLRIHVKQNIMYYMQAIWDHEPPDQRFFRLYNKLIGIPGPAGQGVGWSQMDLVELADLDNPLGYKGNYIIFPLRKPTFITNYMLSQFVDDYFGVRDPDRFGNFTIEELGAYVETQLKRTDLSQKDKDALKQIFLNHLDVARRTTDEIIVPTGQLFIEALTGTHPLLEDFKLLHRVQDVRKVKAEVRHAELENLRLASRLVAGQSDPTLVPEIWEDPDIEKKIVIKGDASVEANTD